MQFDSGEINLVITFTRCSIMCITDGIMLMTWLMHNKSIQYAFGLMGPEAFNFVVQI